MEFHKYGPVTSSAQDAIEYLYSLIEKKNASNLDTTYQETEVAWMEIMWHLEKKPYYRIWPDVFEMFMKTKPVESKFIQIPNMALTVEFPKCLGLPMRSAMFQVKDQEVFNKTWLKILKSDEARLAATPDADIHSTESLTKFAAQMLEKTVSEKYMNGPTEDVVLNTLDKPVTVDVDTASFSTSIPRHRPRTLVCALYYGPEAKHGRFVRTVRFEPDEIFDGTPVKEITFGEEWKKNDLADVDELTRHSQIAFRVLSGLSIIASDPDPDADLFEEVLLAKDRKKVTADPSCRPAMVEKAIRRQKSKGFEIGRGFHEKKEAGAPEYAVGAHFQHYWVGKKNSEERKRIYKVRRGYVVGLKEATKVPTGYYAEDE